MSVRAIRTTATSIDVSVATTFPWTLLPSCVLTVTREAPSTTCAAVRMSPFPSATKPEPSPPPVSIWTTEGRIFAAVSARGSAPDVPVGGAVGLADPGWELPEPPLDAVPPAPACPPPVLAEGAAPFRDWSEPDDDRLIAAEPVASDGAATAATTPTATRAAAAAPTANVRRRPRCRAGSA